MGSSAETGARRGKRGVRTGIDMLIFAALVALTVLAARPLQTVLLERLTGLRDDLIGRAEDVLGLRIRYESMGPSLFSAVDIRRLRLYGNGPEPLISISRLRISYSLIALLTGDFERAFHSITLDNPVLLLDDNARADLTRLIERLGTGSRPITYYLERLPRNLRVRVQGAECSLSYRGSRFLVMGFNLDSAVLEDGRIQARGGWNAGAQLAVFSGQDALSLEMTGRVTGEFDAKRREGSLNLEVPSLSGDRFSVKTVAFDLDIDTERLSLRKKSGPPFDLNLDYTFAGGLVSGEFHADSFSPAEILVLRGPWSEYNRFLAAAASGSASVSFDREAGLRYSLDLRGNQDGSAAIGPFSYELRCRGDTERIAFDTLEIRSPQGNARFSGGLGLQPLAPNGTITLSGVSRTGDGELNAELAVAAQGGRIDIAGAAFVDAASGGAASADGTRLSALNAVILQGRDSLEFSVSARCSAAEPEASGGLAGSEFTAEGVLEYAPRRLEASFAADALSAADLVNLARPFVNLIPTDTAALMLPSALSVLRDVSLSTEIFFSTDFEHILYNAPRFSAAYKGLIKADAAVSGTDRRFDLNEVRLAWDGGVAKFVASVDFAPGANRLDTTGQDLTFSLSGSYLDIPYTLDGFIERGQALSLQGSYGLSAMIAVDGQGGYAGYLKADAIPLPFRGQFARLRVSSVLRYESRDSWSVDLENLALTGIATPSSTGAALRASGNVDQDWAFFPMLYYEDNEGALSGRAAFNWTRDWNGITAQIQLEDAAGEERYRLEGNYQDGADIRFSGAGIRLNRLFPHARGAVASGDARLIWTSPDSYALTANLESLTANDGEQRVALSGRGFLDEEELRVEELQFRYGNFQGELPLLRMNRREAGIQTSLRVWGPAAGRNMDLSLVFQAGFAAPASWFSLNTALDSFNGSLRVEEFRYGALESEEPFVFTFFRDAEALSLSGGPGDMFRFRLASDGAFYAGFSAPAPLRGSLSGLITGRNIDAHTSNLYIDLVSLWRFLPSQNIITCAGGFVNADLSIRGSLADPEFFGTARAQSVRLAVPQYVDAEIGPTPITLTFEGNEMRFGPLTTPAGSGEGTIQGWFQFDRWIPTVFTLDIQSPPERPIPFKVDVQGVAVKGKTSGSIHLAREDAVLAVTGSLTGEETEITLNTQELSAGGFAAGTAAKPVTTDLVIWAGRKMEFLWPSAELPILRTYANAGNSIRIKSDSVAGVFSVTGDVSVRSGELYYFQRSFYIREGALSFNENETRFDPRLTMRAEARDRNEEGPVTISLLVDNAPLKSFTARFESNPPLSQIEILSLLGSILPESGAAGAERSGFSAILEPASDFLSQFYLVRNVERRVRDFLRLDMLSFRTLFIQNAFMQLTGLRNPVDRLGKLGNYLDNTTVFIGKYFGANIFTQAMVSLRYDENKNELGRLTPELDLGFELQNPLFDIRFNVVPQHPENLFINDMSFTLSWRRSF